MVRRSPSAVNKQPWRIVMQGETIHFYRESTLEMSRIDMGIALCHFHLAVQEKGLTGTFLIQDPLIDTKYKYVVSWIKQ